MSPFRLVIPGVFLAAAASLAAAPPVWPVGKPFPLADVRLLDGPFKVAQDKDVEYLLKLEPDRLLARMREAAGLPAKGAEHGGWEKMVPVSSGIT